MENIKEKVDQFQVEFDNYITYLIEFVDAKGKADSKYRTEHFLLVETSIKLQARFYALPEKLKERLLLVGFEIFLHCDNIVDFYNFRNFIYDENLLLATASISQRVDSELKLVREIVNNSKFDDYINAIPRNYDFFMPEKIFNIMEYCKLKYSKGKDLSSNEACLEKVNVKSDVCYVEKEVEINSEINDHAYSEILTNSKIVVDLANGIFDLIGKYGKGFGFYNIIKNIIK